MIIQIVRILLVFSFIKDKLEAMYLQPELHKFVLWHFLKLLNSKESPTRVGYTACFLICNNILSLKGRKPALRRFIGLGVTKITLSISMFYYSIIKYLKDMFNF